MSQSALCQSDCSIFKWTKSSEQTNETVCFLASWYQFKQIKFWSIILWVGMAKKRCGQSNYEILKLNVSKERTVGILTNFLHDAPNSGKLKAASIIFW